MSREQENAGDPHEYDYGRVKSEIREELRAYEGHGPPSVDQLWGVAQYESESVAGWIADMPPTESEIKTAKVDVLKALVALEMAEERIDGGEENGRD